METQGPVPTQRRYTLHEDFFDVLEVVGAIKDQEYEWKDVIMLFIRYLAKRKPSLLDPNNKSRVLCGDDPLGRVFGLNCFTKEQTRLLVRQHVSLVEDERLYASLPPLPPITGPCPPPELEPLKRDSPCDYQDSPESKRSRPEPAAGAGAGPGPSVAPAAEALPSPAAQLQRMDTLEATDACPDGAPVPPAHETEDEPDTCDEAEDHRKTYAREMEPVECTDVSDSDASSGESDIESPLHLTMLAVWMDDVGMMADLETSESDSEYRDTWACLSPDCQHTNSARKSRCDRCWKMRPAWVVGPRQRRKKRRQRDQARSSLSALSRSSADQARSCRGSAAPSSGSANTSQTDSGSVTSQDAGYGSQETCSTASSPPPPPTEQETCIICCEKSRDAAIIHGRTGCQVTCYGCARKLWKKRDLCPSCRRTIEKIVFMRFG